MDFNLHPTHLHIIVLRKEIGETLHFIQMSFQQKYV
jgi:hypothetical protein